MPRKKAPARITSHKEMLERISFETGRAILSHLENPKSAQTTTAAIDRGIDYLKLNNFDTDAVVKAQREREVMKRAASKNRDAGGPISSNTSFTVAPIDAEHAELLDSMNQLPSFGDPYAETKVAIKIPDRSNQ